MKINAGPSDYEVKLLQKVDSLLAFEYDGELKRALYFRASFVECPMC